jgi:peroxiredoxin
VGDPLPAFALAETEGKTVTAADLTARGPVVITFYRGDW